MNTNLKISNVTKIYPGCVANDNVSLEFNSGKIYALLGENGAGKSTLVKILSGVIIPDEGKIYLNENNLKLNSPLDAKKNDIGMVFQHFNLFETLSVFENLIIDSDEERESLREKIDTIMKKYNFSIDLDIPVLNLSAGQKQKVEIIRCLIRSPKVLIMDEPTSVLTCLLYTSDAADDMQCVDLGGRRIIKKKYQKLSNQYQENKDGNSIPLN